MIHKLHSLGYIITQIARELNLDRKTVRSHLARNAPPARDVRWVPMDRLSGKDRLGIFLF